MIARSLWVSIFFEHRAFGFLLLSIGLVAPASPSFAIENECGELKIVGYWAKRIMGDFEFRVAVTPERERIEDVGGAGMIQIVDLATQKTQMINPKAKVVAILPSPKPPLPSRQPGVEKFVERETEKDGVTKVTVGLKTPKGKEWLIQTNCRISDGIWLERRIRTPRGIIESKQSDIRVESIPASLFEAPSDYKTVQPPRK